LLLGENRSVSLFGSHDGAFGCIGGTKESTLGRFVVHLAEDTRFGLRHRPFATVSASKDKFLLGERYQQTRYRNFFVNVAVNLPKYLGRTRL